MTTVITAPDHFSETSQLRKYHKAFLAGAIDMGAAVDWQAQTIELLDGHDLLLFNPRRAAFTPDTLDEQINWELKHLELADTVFMWFPKDAKAPVAMFETGLFMQSGKLAVGADPEFYRRRNLELTCEHYKVDLYASLGATIAALLKRMYAK